ncbi:unnamed protein product [Penicillium salamii]|uniref:F-box domain-containing protein n=1 Tax=Penicillium salamii TaxID=1612424 RepID=A0A9W4JFG3_9EURO|nr:unnamed protein product [Penicillium salamii]CAG7981902.1 unnamed protein product [Penicillium salamii]CAG8017480.1 unnamed protein product [Penicillium salamii]CAG8026695.1 unnamed protein product [Penicillium salamii]CAG8074801.1 unnamed protein product [Penicillium salamii]
MQSLISSGWSATPRMLGTVRDRPSATPYTNKLAGLPVELLLSTTDFLSVDDWICLSLCNRRLFAIYHRRYNSTQLPKEMKLSVLGRLERDLPQYFVCYDCLILHKDDGSGFLGLSDPFTQQSCPLPCYPNSPIRLILQSSCGFDSLRKFKFLDIQQVMRRFYLGDPFGTSTEALSYTQVKVRHARPDMTSIFSTDAQICSEQPALYFRIQHAIVVPGKEWRLLLQIVSSMVICTHMKHSCEVMIPVRLAYRSGGKNSSSDFNCHYCNTDAHIEFRKHVSWVALILTTWINLGSGLTPDDRRWKIHTHRGTHFRCDSTELKDSPRVFFENASPFSLEALLLRNLSYIQDQRYRQIMQPVPPDPRDFGGFDAWYLPSIPSSPSSPDLPSEPEISSRANW